MDPKMGTFKDLCSLVSETFGLSVFWFNPDGEISLEISHHQILNPLYQEKKQILFDLLKFVPDQEHSNPYIKKTLFLENYLIMSIISNNIFEGTVLIGPSIPYHLSDDEMNRLINATKAFTYKKRLVRYYQSVPVISNEKLVNMSVMINYIFNQKLVKFESILHEDYDQMNMDNPVIEVSRRLQQVSFHHDPLTERHFFNLVKQGRADEVKKSIKKILKDEEFGTLSKSSFIRSKKNLIITGITIATRYAIDGGLHPEVAYTLSDFYIQRLEELNEATEVSQLFLEALYTFAKKVSKSNEQRFSKTITTCQHYIFKHIYSEISHTDLAKELMLNPNYLSVLFKKEVGISLSEYIQRTKIEEAKNLLLYSNTPLSEIASWLNFTDQSYFTKVFKKHEGITPKLYRERKNGRQ
jgi:AraC-like DNA-binding protein